MKARFTTRYKPEAKPELKVKAWLKFPVSPKINQSIGAKRTISNMTKVMRLDTVWLHALRHTTETALLQRFAAAAARGDFAVVQEFLTYHYHHNATAERMLKLCDKPLMAEYIASKLFYKVFPLITPARSLRLPHAAHALHSN